MSAAAGGFADQRGALQIFQVVAELFAAGEGVVRREDVDWLASEQFSRHIGQRPILMRDVAFALPEIVQVRGLVK